MPEKEEQNTSITLTPAPQRRKQLRARLLRLRLAFELRVGFKLGTRFTPQLGRQPDWNLSNGDSVDFWAGQNVHAFSHTPSLEIARSQRLGVRESAQAPAGARASRPAAPPTPPTGVEPLDTVCKE